MFGTSVEYLIVDPLTGDYWRCRISEISEISEYARLRAQGYTHVIHILQSSDKTVEERKFALSYTDFAKLEQSVKISLPEAPLWTGTASFFAKLLGETFPPLKLCHARVTVYDIVAKVEPLTATRPALFLFIDIDPRYRALLYMPQREGLVNYAYYVWSNYITDVRKGDRLLITQDTLNTILKYSFEPVELPNETLLYIVSGAVEIKRDQVTGEKFVAFKEGYTPELLRSIMTGSYLLQYIDYIPDEKRRRELLEFAVLGSVYYRNLCKKLLDFIETALQTTRDHALSLQLSVLKESFERLKKEYEEIEMLARELGLDIEQLSVLARLKRTQVPAAGPGAPAKPS
jgi:hypothetical protein